MSGGVGEHFRLWLRAGMTGCEFAKLLPGKAGRVAVEVHLDEAVPPTSWLNNAFDEHAKANRVVIAVFPQLATERALVEFLHMLGTDPRWHVSLRSKASPRGDALVGLEWRTSAGDLTEAMGFAPFPAMPVPRRAPYAAIAMWPGGHQNPFRGRGQTPPGRSGAVSFLDASHGFPEAEYEELWTRTSQQVSTLMAVPVDDSRLYRRTAFVLPREHATKLAND